MDCCMMPELELAEWGNQLKAQMNGRRYPLNGMFELTDRCNLGCVHCFINQPAASQDARAHELSTTQVKEILDQVADAGCLFLTLTGGEILIRTDFEEIYRHAKQKGFLLTLFTNGTMITQRIADMFEAYRPRSIELTMYGATRETYEAVTGVPGSYDRFRRGIELLLERGLPVKLKTMLITLNFHELSAMRAFAESLGLSFRFDGLLWPRFDGSKNIRTQQIRLEDLVALDDMDPNRMLEWKRIAEQYSGELTRAERVFFCGAGMYNFHIDSHGRMSICTMTRQPNFSILENGFLEAWSHIGELRKLKRQKETICQTCTLGALCQQCPGWSQAAHGDNETPVEFVCKLAHLRNTQISGV